SRREAGQEEVISDCKNLPRIAKSFEELETAPQTANVEPANHSGLWYRSAHAPYNPGNAGNLGNPGNPVSLIHTFEQAYRELRPGTPVPEYEVGFFAFANPNNTIRLRRGRVLVRLSDLLEGAPSAVLHAILHILIAKLYRRPIDPAHAARYRRFTG